LAANGALQGKTIDDWHLARELSALIGEHPAVRIYVYDLLKNRPGTGALSLLARSVAQNPDEDGLMLLIELENELQISFAGPRAIQGVVTKDVPIEYGLPEGEPRHPDLASGRPWPMMAVDPYAAGKH
jgi:hypothetical protein